MKAYIIASSVISPQPTFDADGFPGDSIGRVTNRLTCIEPDYRSIINPIQLRRMPRILKMGLAASQMCINRAGHVNPDAIIVGTGLGCLDNLEKFLMEMLNSNEHVSSVLPFINSTHNAVAAHIAMLLKNHNYNITYCHRGFSFESALIDALMHVEDNHHCHVLVGGIDECTDDFILLHSHLKYWKEPLNNLELLSEKTPGTIAGEGSAFFMLSGVPGNGESGVSVEGVHTFFAPRNAEIIDIKYEIDHFLGTISTEKQDIDGVLLGINGDVRYDSMYTDLIEDYFTAQTGFLYYKHLCGEYYTSGAFALWLGMVILEKQTVPGLVTLKRGDHHAFKNLLIYNQIRNEEHSLIFLKYDQL